MDHVTLGGNTSANPPALELPPPPPPPLAQPHLLERIVEGAHETIDRLAEHAAPHVQRIEETVSGANQLLHDRADQARDVGQEWLDSLRGTVREHPIAALAAALAAGVLIARLAQSPR